MKRAKTALLALLFLPVLAFADGKSVYSSGKVDAKVSQALADAKAYTTAVSNKVETAGYATQAWVGQQGFVDSSVTNGVVSWVEGKGYATQSWVGTQGYATQSWVGQQGFLTSAYDSAVDAKIAAVVTNLVTTGITIGGHVYRLVEVSE